MLTPSDDALFTEAKESNYSQSHAVLDTSVSTISVQEDNMLEDLGNSVSADDCFGRINSEMESEQAVIQQYDRTDEKCTRAESELNLRKDDVLETDLTRHQKYFPTSVDVEECENSIKFTGQSVPLSESEPHASNDTALEPDGMPLRCPSMSVDVLDPEGESCIPEVVEVQNDKNEETSALSGESDSDCVIECVSGTESSDRQLVEGELAVRALRLDHAYCLHAGSVRHCSVVASSSRISEEYTSPASDPNFSVHSMQASDYCVTPILPFPNLNIDHLCSQSQSDENPTDGASLLGTASVEMMDTGVSGHGDENDSLAMDDYPVVEIIPCGEEDEGGSDMQQTQFSLSSPVSCSTADISGQPAVTDARSDNPTSDAMTASTSRRVRVSIVTSTILFVYAYHKPMKVFFTDGMLASLISHKFMHLAFAGLIKIVIFNNINKK